MPQVLCVWSMKLRLYRRKENREPRTDRTEQAAKRLRAGSVKLCASTSWHLMGGNKGYSHLNTYYLTGIGDKCDNDFVTRTLETASPPCPWILLANFLKQNMNVEQGRWTPCNRLCNPFRRLKLRNNETKQKVACSIELPHKMYVSKVAISLTMSALRLWCFKKASTREQDNYGTPSKLLFVGCHKFVYDRSRGLLLYQFSLSSSFGRSIQTSFHIVPD